MLRTYLIMTWSIFDYDWFEFNNYAQFARIIFSMIIPPSEPAPVIICITYYCYWWLRDCANCNQGEYEGREKPFIAMKWDGTLMYTVSSFSKGMLSILIWSTLILNLHFVIQPVSSSFKFSLFGTIVIQADNGLHNGQALMREGHTPCYYTHTMVI